ncbi:hypothetical protein [Fimbriimonas ginsengisoli]|uniref:Uncharacterized protein n=1 Tax=Fimbriimonas ginsengisoli Gsoil 348 TaxID=661478 RepID=A0A068NQL5_FIMGI|nr:hypothetical protein [Fimbriimonas ginsengisoli]AIE85721.1 hypothetical protein OP10G_2353 [Fimbriimonas ginsengisoli Gsoil 348]
MNDARMLKFALFTVCLAGCGGGGGGGSDSNSLEGHYSGSFSAEGVGAGTVDVTIYSGNRVSGTTVNSAASNRHGLFVGRIIDSTISGSVLEDAQQEKGFTGTVDKGNGQLTLHLTFNGLNTTATYTLTKN